MIVFDMNETTLDMTGVRNAVDSIAAEAGGFKVWFQRLLQSAMTVSATGSEFVAFGELARSSLEATLASAGRRLTDSEWDRVAESLRKLTPHPDAPDGLQRLRAAGRSTMALTNTGQPSLETTCDSTGLTPLFDHLVSVESVGVYKPFAAPYLHAADVADLAPDDMWMVACHDWDIAGAKAVGFLTAFIERPGFTFSSSYPAPDLSVPDFNALADELI